MTKNLKLSGQVSLTVNFYDQVHLAEFGKLISNRQNII